MGDVTLPAPPRRTRRPAAFARGLAALVLASLVVVGTATGAAADVVQVSASPSTVEGGESVFVTVSLAAADCTGVPVTVSLGSESRSLQFGSDCQLFETFTAKTPASCPRSGGSAPVRAVVTGSTANFSVQVTCPPPPPAPPTSKPPKATPTPTPTPTPSDQAPPPVTATVTPPNSTPAAGSPVAAVQTPSPIPTLSPVVVAALAPLLPLDDGGPQPPTRTGGGGLGDDAAAVGVLVLGGLVTLLLWRRGHSRPVVGAGVATTMVVAALVVVAPVALAKDPAPSSSVRLRPTSVVVAVTPGKTGTANAECPAGSVLVGGGARTSLPNDATPATKAALLLSTSRPTANGWQAVATAPDDATVQLTALALCTTDDGVEASLATQAPVPVPAGAAGRTQARCPAGHPLAVGWSADQAWSVVALPLAQGSSLASWANEPTSATASLLCTTTASTLHVVRYDGSTLEIGPGADGTAEAICPTGSAAVGGGFVAAASVGGRVTRVAVLEATPSADHFRVKAAASNGSGGVLLTAYALCVPTS